MPERNLNPYRILIPEMIRGATRYPPGTIEHLLSLGRVDGDWLVLSEEEYARYRDALGAVKCPGCGQ